MAALTWRNVDAPSFDGSTASLALATRSLNNAFSGAADAINAFDKTNTDAANRAIQIQLAQLQNPEDAQKLPGMLAAVDPRRLSGETLGMFNSKPGDLINQATARDNYAWNTFSRDRTKNQWSAEDAAVPIVAGSYGAVDPNNPDAMTNYIKSHPLPAGMSMDALTGAMSSMTGAQSAATGAASSVLALKTGQFNFNELINNKADADAATAALAQLVAGGTYDPTVIAQNLEKMRPGMKPEVYFAVKGRIGQLAMTENDFADMTPLPPSFGGSGGVGGVDPTRVMNREAAGKGFAAVPENVKTLGQASEFASSVNKAGVKSSAMGVYQIVGATLRGAAPKVLGADWQTKDFNFENQDKIAEYIFNQNRGSVEAIKSQWVSLSDADAARVIKMPWVQAREIIAAGESSSSPSVIAQALVQAGTQVRSNEVNASPMADGYARASRTNMAKDEAVSVLMTMNQFKNQDSSLIGDYLEKIVTEGKKQNVPGMNYSLAVEVMRNGTSGSWWQRNAKVWMGGNEPGGENLDDAKIQAGFDFIKSGGVAKAATANAQIAANLQQGQYLQSLYSRALDKYSKAKYARDTFGQQVDLAPLEAEVRNASAALAQHINNTGNDRNLTTFPGGADAPAQNSTVTKPTPKNNVASQDARNKLNIALAAATKATAEANKKHDGFTPGYKILGSSIAARKAQNEAIVAARNSGLPEFKQKPGEGNIVYNERLRRQLGFPVAG